MSIVKDKVFALNKNCIYVLKIWPNSNLVLFWDKVDKILTLSF